MGTDKVNEQIALSRIVEVLEEILRSAKTDVSGKWISKRHLQDYLTTLKENGSVS